MPMRKTKCFIFFKCQRKVLKKKLIFFKAFSFKKKGNKIVQNILLAPNIGYLGTTCNILTMFDQLKKKLKNIKIS